VLVIKFTNEDLNEDVARITGKSVEQIRTVSLDLWHFVLMYLQHPEDYFYKGIKIENCIKIPVNPKRVLKKYKFACENWNGSDYQIRLVKFHKLLLENGCYTQRQKEVADNLARPESFLTGIEGSVLHGKEPERCSTTDGSGKEVAGGD
jgi:hypothetical protein